jgi:hypothetical protein
VTVRRGDLVVGVEVTGELRASDSSIIGPPPLAEVWNFSITKLAAEGTVVEKGDVVLSFDAAELEQRLIERQGERQSVEENLAKRVREAEQARREEGLRTAELEAAVRKAQLRAEVEPEISSSVDLKTAAVDLVLARAELAAAQERAAAAILRDAAEIEGQRERAERARREEEDTREAIAAMKVRAPRSGVLIGLPGRRGEKPKAGDRVWRSQRVAEIVELGSLYGWGQVDEADASRLAVGLPVSIRLDAQGDVEIRGTVRSMLGSVQRAGRDDPNRVVRVELALEARDGVDLRPGMRFRGEVEAQRFPAVLLVPLESVRADARGARVWGPDGRPRTLELGARNRRDVEVRNGVELGDALLRTPPQEGT